ncbi:MAG: hypothetical protein LBG87_05155 [Spirochaetaceae bacterium]|nr:hypothetical protein [Spirochaetaceae bacterium]
MKYALVVIMFYIFFMRWRGVYWVGGSAGCTGWGGSIGWGVSGGRSR